jgi:hypothetical protein
MRDLQIVFVNIPLGWSERQPTVVHEGIFLLKRNGPEPDDAVCATLLRIAEKSGTRNDFASARPTGGTMALLVVTVSMTNFG